LTIIFLIMIIAHFLLHQFIFTVMYLIITGFAHYI
jgi:hypothetical protein